LIGELVTDSDREFETLVAPHYPRLLRRLALIVRDPEEAKDLAQATLVRAFEAWHTVDRDEVGPWLMTIGTRLALNEVRRNRRRPSFRLDSEIVSFDDETDDQLWKALGEIRREERAALLLTVLGGYSYAEVASQLEVPAGTAAAWISRAKSHLRGRLMKESGGAYRLRSGA
jgi:RNA polymerase sigma-70 factor (ECF subfamily)